jgi:CRP-like cAMP-binding protein
VSITAYRSIAAHERSRANRQAAANSLSELPYKQSWGDAVSGNQLLAVMAASDLDRLKPNLEEMALVQEQILFQADQAITHVYFPHDGVISLQILGRDGAVVEAATIGNEGMVGLGGLLAGDVSYTRQIVQLPGRASRVARDPFLSAVNASRSLRRFLASHADAFAAQVLQTAACNAQHSTEERMARWLLTAFDRCDTDRINLTHDDLAIAFGVRRPTVTLIVRSLQAAQLLDATRGAIAVIDRQGLEQISCECYEAIRKNYERVFAQDSR